MAQNKGGVKSRNFDSLKGLNTPGSTKAISVPKGPEVKMAASKKGGGTGGVKSKGFGDTKGSGYMGIKTVKGGGSGGKKSGK